MKNFMKKALGYSVLAVSIVVIAASLTINSGCAAPKPSAPVGNPAATTPKPNVPLSNPIVMPTQLQSDAEPLAILNNEPITDKEVMAKANKRMVKIMSQVYDIKKDVIDDIIDDRLLNAEAKKKSTTPDKLIETATKTTIPPTDDEAKAVYNMQKDRTFQGKAFDDVKESIKNQITNQKQHAAVNEYLASLRKGATIKINLERPRLEVSVDDDPSQGPANAPITLIEFSEFQCPFCKRARPTLAKILETYGNKIHYVFRDFPLSFHKDARLAANAANCANEQGKYWDFNSKLFDSQPNLGDDVYKKIATDLGLNMDNFNKCVAAKKYDKEIDKDQSDGMDIGVTGTPAYFINGVFLSGAQPLDAFKDVIDDELARKGVK